MRARLAGLKGVTLTDLGAVKGAIVTFAVAGADHVGAARRACVPRRSTSPSRRSSPRGPTSRAADCVNVMRASVHVYNTEAELDRFVAALDAQRSRS